MSLVPDIHEKSIDREALYAWVKEISQLVPAVAEEEVLVRSASDEEKKELQMKDSIILVIKEFLICRMRPH